jgi:IS1 family transposase/transposase-like protein
MTCHNCKAEMVKAGFYGKSKIQRFKCQQCGKRLSEPPQKPFGADIRIPREKVVMILHCLVEGNSVRSTSRLCDVEKRTVLTILRLAGDACERFLSERIQNVVVKDLECDEAWTFTFKKEGHKYEDELNNEKIGDSYVFIGLERHTKLVVAWHLGRRDRQSTETFIGKIRRATADTEFDICTDTFGAYPTAIDLILRDRANHAQVVKLFEGAEEGRERYSPGEFVTVEKKAILGQPDLRVAGTSRVERLNGSVRQWVKRMTRLTYAFSKKWENLRAALALHFAYYNYCRQHSTTRTTPAQEANLTDHIWTLEELVSTL